MGVEPYVGWRYVFRLDDVDLGGVNRSGHPLLLCIDQFEELFTLSPAALRSKFVAALSAMTDPADSRVRVVIAVRAETNGPAAARLGLATNPRPNPLYGRAGRMVTHIVLEQAAASRPRRQSTGL